MFPSDRTNNVRSGTACMKVSVSVFDMVLAFGNVLRVSAAACRANQFFDGIVRSVLGAQHAQSAPCGGRACVGVERGEQIGDVVSRRRTAPADPRISLRLGFEQRGI